MRTVIIFRIVLTVIACLTLGGFLTAAYVLKNQWYIANLGFAQLGVYGLLLIVLFLSQQIFSLLNNNYWIPKLLKNSANLPKTGLMVVGYREDPVLFRGCLLSLAQQDYFKIGRIVVGIDGIEDRDKLMEQVFLDVFPDGTTVRLDRLYQDLSMEEKEQLHKLIDSSVKYLCISQPHSGKREIMYTAMNMFTSDTEYLCFTDSDTFFEQNTLTEMVRVMDGHDQLRKRDPKMRTCGAVTGNVEIWNKENMISYLSALRYWFAFNVERSADSFFGVVNCISGPLGLYKKSIIDQIKDQWVHQTFLGTKCTFGDDRHLTNLILLKGHCTFYTPLSKCKTDTPAELFRWIAQQTRWCKSFHTQFLINIKAFHKQPFWLAWQLVFQTVAPLFIFATLIWFITVSINVYCVTVSMVFIMGFLRGLICVVRSKQLAFFYYTFYVVMYLLFLIPCKFWGLFTFWNNQWGTTDRLGRNSPILKALHALIWAVFFVSYYIAFGIKHLVSGQKIKQPATLYVFIGCLGFVVLLFMHWLIYSNCYLFPKNKKQFEQNKIRIEGQIVKRKLLVQDIGNFIYFKSKSSSEESDKQTQKQINNLAKLREENLKGSMDSKDIRTTSATHIYRFADMN